MANFARGIRNHNPGNIRHGGGNWLGLATSQPDASFCTFTAPVYGLRALAKILLKYNSSYGLNTLYGILNRYAPAIENDTKSYIQAVARKLGVNQHDKVDVAANLLPLMRAIVAHECGAGAENTYPDTLYQQAIKMAVGG